MLLISCSLFLPLVRFPVILPSRTSRNNTSCRRTCPSHVRFRWFIVLMKQRFSSTRFTTSELLTFAVQLIFSIFLHIHISYIYIFHILYYTCQLIYNYETDNTQNFNIILYIIFTECIYKQETKKRKIQTKTELSLTGNETQIYQLIHYVRLSLYQWQEFHNVSFCNSAYGSAAVWWGSGCPWKQ